MTQEPPGETGTAGEVLGGGNSSRVVKDGDSVIRQTGPWSPFVHHLLRYLAAHGFTASPVVIEATASTERLSFLAGDVGNDPLAPEVQTDQVLIDAARLLRRFHDLTAHFVIPEGAVFQLPPASDPPWDVICHNDFAPYNCVFRAGRLVGIIDFDTAGPGSRLWDIAYAVYRFVPLMHDAHAQANGWHPIPDRARRLRLFCDAYGLDDPAARAALIETVIARLTSLIDYIRQAATTLEDIPLYQRDIAYIGENREVFARALT